MSVVLTIRDVPEDVRDTLARDAQENGQSLQAFLLGVLGHRAEFSRNRELLDEVKRDLARGGGAGPSTPNAADVLDAARRERGGTP
jgi:hypothetical protein